MLPGEEISQGNMFAWAILVCKKHNMKNIFTTFGLIICFGVQLLAQGSLNNTFYVFNNCVRTLPGAPEALDDQISLIKNLGYDGMGGHHSQDNLLLLKALNKVGLEMPEVYWPVTLENNGEVTYDQRLYKIIKKSARQDVLVTLVLSTDKYMDDPEKGDPLFAQGLRKIADFAAKYNTKIAIYPHVNNYCETIDHTLRLAKLINRDNAGMVFNLCHFLKVEGAQDWKDKLSKALPQTFMVSINGADNGDTQEMGWDQLIQPLGEGTFDVFQIVQFLSENGYSEKIGLQCYNIDQDCETALRKSMDAWNQFNKDLK